MQELVSIFLIGISLSMDTFSLSLSLGTLGNQNRYLSLFPALVGIFHFFMPLLGNFIGMKIIMLFNVASNILLGLILIFLGVNLAINYFKNDDIEVHFRIWSISFLAFSVSIDSFTVGLAISDITKNYLLASTIFALCSAAFTFLGITIGKYCNNLIGKYASMVGILLLLVLGIMHLF